MRIVVWPCAEIRRTPRFCPPQTPRIAEFIGAFDRNRAALFETAGRMVCIGADFKKHLRDQIGSLK